MELQQSPAYAEYIRALHWLVFRADGVQMFYKNIPLLGGLLKIQRPGRLPAPGTLKNLVREYKVKTVAIDPVEKQDVRSYKKWVIAVSAFTRVVRSGYMPTKTILVDLRPPEEEMFRRFSEAKRRAVRKAQKNGVVVKESRDIRELISVKNKSGGFLGFITTFGVDKFWNIMSPDHTAILLAKSDRQNLVGGILILFWKGTAYYWVAGATHEGKKLFAPTLLVWEALRTAKQRGAKWFDFLGVWDERRSTEHHDWKGFTRFKEGFGGKTKYYPVY